MSAQVRGLGRGLGALIPSAATGSPPTHAAEEGAGQRTNLLEVPVEDICPNPHQPRHQIEPETLEELAASIREHGVIQPLIVTHGRAEAAAPFQLIAGERRWRAARLAGLSSVPVLVKEASSQELLELALIENIQRADLNPLEEASAYQSLVADFGLTQNDIARRVGKSRVAVANVLRLLRLPARVKDLLSAGALSEGHARALLGLPDEQIMAQLADQVVARGLNVRQTEDLVRRFEVTEPAEPSGPEPDDPQTSQTRQLEDVFRTALGTKVSLTRGRHGGKLIIHFYSDEELQSIYEQIVRSE